MDELIDNIIQKSIESYDGNFELDNNFEELMSFGELVDRLSIVNFKLFTLKDEVMRRQSDKGFCAWASVEDVRLVKERSRLKKCIDQKLLSMIARLTGGDTTGGFNPEVKKYGDKYE
jgi:hypothetical protein